VFAVAEKPTADPTGAVCGFADATGRFLPLVCTLNATKVTDTMGRILGVPREELEELALRSPAGANGTVLLPYLDGERTPNRPKATGFLTGLRTSTERADLARAAYEGVVCGLLDGLDALTAAGVDTSGRLFLVGGGSRSDAYRRIVADLAGRPVIVADDPESVATGSCVQAAAVLSGTPPAEIAEAWQLGTGTIYEPDRSVDAGAVRSAYGAVREG
jgi:xylulokinase